MKIRNFLIITFFATFLEIIFKSSHLAPFFELELIFIICLILLNSANKTAVFSFLISATILVEMVMQQEVGVSAFSLFLAVILENLVQTVVSFVSKESYTMRTLLVLLLALIIKSFILTTFKFQDFFISAGGVIFNIIVCVVILYFVNRLAPKKHVLKT